ncbi:MAG: sigma-70 family RNA polymerase sigma factor [Verrucomicrobiales bacterium]|nr:sigma-70 family RNA polymerase sigma factor [Verrucomicrobiales bacterium]
MPPAPDRPVDAEVDPMPRLRQTLRAFIGSRVRDAALADDLAQETLLRVETRLQTLRSRDRLDAWVFQIARHTIADHFRTARETEEFDETAHGPLLANSDAAPTAEEEALSGDLRNYLRSVVDRLPPVYSEAIRLIELEGLSQVELARRLGLSVSAAKSRVQRGRAMLRKEMERCCHWETDRYGTVLAVEPRSSCTCQNTDSTGCEK